MERSKYKEYDFQIVWVNDLDDPGGLQTANIERIMQEITAFSIKKPDKPIFLFIYSDGGNCLQVDELCDFIKRHIVSPIVTVAIMDVKSSACDLLQIGHFRVALEGSSLLFHYSKDVLEDNYSEHEIEKILKKAKEYNTSTFKRTVSSRPEHTNPCKLSAKELMARINKRRKESKREYIIKSKTAMELGFVDRVIKALNPRSLQDIENKVIDLCEEQKEKLRAKRRRKKR